MVERLSETLQLLDDDLKYNPLAGSLARRLINNADKVEEDELYKIYLELTSK